jgi:hypothetical protein
MHTIIFPHSDKVTVKQKGKVTAGTIDLAFALNFMFGQYSVEFFLTPILKELHLDTERFFKVFWKHVDKNSQEGL